MVCIARRRGAVEPAAVASSKHRAARRSCAVRRRSGQHSYATCGPVSRRRRRRGQCCWSERIAFLGGPGWERAVRCRIGSASNRECAATGPEVRLAARCSRLRKRTSGPCPHRGAAAASLGSVGKRLRPRHARESYVARPASSGALPPSAVEASGNLSKLNEQSGRRRERCVPRESTDARG